MSTYDPAVIRLFRSALLDIRRIARRGGRDAEAWQATVETIEKALAEGRRMDAEAESEGRQ
jgi:hypothetical protein